MMDQEDLMTVQEEWMTAQEEWMTAHEEWTTVQEGSMMVLEGWMMDHAEWMTGLPTEVLAVGMTWIVGVMMAHETSNEAQFQKATLGDVTLNLKKMPGAVVVHEVAEMEETWVEEIW